MLAGSLRGGTARSRRRRAIDLCAEVIGHVHLDERVGIENERHERLLSVEFRDVVQISEA